MDEIEFYLEDLKTKFTKINPSDYYLSYSGGKDSHFLYWFIKEYAHIEGIEVVSFNTFMEHTQILQRMRKYADIILTPKMKPFEIKEKYGSPCFSKWQDEMISRYQRGVKTENTMGAITGEGRTVYKISKTAKELVLSGKLHKVSNKCCENLKKKPVKEYEKLTGKKAIMGVRGTESAIRKQQYQSCFTKDKKFTPIWDLSDSLMDAIYERYNIELPPIYAELGRTGCMGCPYGSFSGNTTKELRLISKAQRKFVGEYFKESYEVLGIDIEAIKRECGDYGPVPEYEKITLFEE